MVSPSEDNADHFVLITLVGLGEYCVFYLYNSIVYVDKEHTMKLFTTIYLLNKISNSVAILMPL